MVEQDHKEGLEQEIETKVEEQKVEPERPPQETSTHKTDLEVTKPRTKSIEGKMTPTKGQEKKAMEPPQADHKKRIKSD